MNLKKNAVSYISWMLILVFTAVSFSFFGMISAHLYESDSPLIAVGFVVIFFGIVCFIYFLTGCILKCIPAGKKKISAKSAGFWEAVIVILCMAAGIAVRISQIPLAGEEAAYFDVCKVTGENGISLQAVQGSVYYYCMLLRGLFMVVGNYWSAGIWLQIILQMVGIGFMYLAGKRLTDRLPAFMVLLFTCFAPVSVQAGLTYSPQILYFCFFAIVLFLEAHYLRCSEGKEKHPIGMWLYTVLIGILLGFLCYVDVSGLILFLPLVCIFQIKRDESKILCRILRLVLLAGCAAGFFALLLLADALFSNTTFSGVWNAWIATYGSVGWNGAMLTGKINIELPVLICLISFGVFSFWRRKTADRFTIPVLLVCGISLLHFSSVTADNMDGNYLLYVLMAFLAGVCFMELFYRNTKEISAAEALEADVAAVTEPAAEKKDEAPEAEEARKEEEKLRTIQFFENPLPLPKKHVKKTMDYALVPTVDKMDYDIEVSDTDDYDLKE